MVPPGVRRHRDGQQTTVSVATERHRCDRGYCGSVTTPDSLKLLRNRLRRRSVNDEAGFLGPVPPVERSCNNVVPQRLDTKVRPDRQEAICQSLRLGATDVRVCERLPDEDSVFYRGPVTQHEFRHTRPYENLRHLDSYGAAAPNRDLAASEPLEGRARIPALSDLRSSFVDPTPLNGCLRLAPGVYGFRDFGAHLL